MTELEAPVLYERRGPVAIVTLNRPQVLNAVNAALAGAAGHALEQAASDDQVRAAVITGAGRAFCVGADLKEIARGRSIAAPGFARWGFAGIVRHWIAKPIVAAVNGDALGGGTEIVLACDLAVADEDARLGLPEVRRGLFAAAGGAIRLPRQLPPKIAMELLVTGDPVSAVDAARWGLLNRIAGHGTALDQAIALAERIAECAPIAVQESKRVAVSTLSAGSDWEQEVWRTNSSAIKRVFASDDAREGARAFAERREPTWRGV
jgi:enoyl-CoA hydratase/carnithine racemase